jgi:hypothetical protein
MDPLSLYPGGINSEKNVVKVSEAAMIDHKKVEREVATRFGDTGIYFRFSAAHFLQKNDRKVNLGWLITHTNAYLRDVEVSRKIDACVERCRLNRGLVLLEELGISLPFCLFDVISYKQNQLVRKNTYIRTFLCLPSISWRETNIGK